jgi:hypothetical protein
MKKRVRIYKSPTGEGQFLNKTAQFLRKAQMGGTPNVEDLSYPGQGQAQQAEQEQPDENQLASLVMQDISNSRPKEEIVVKLVNIYGKDPMEASSFVDQMYQYLEQQSAEQKDADDEEEDEEDADANLAAKVEEEAQAPAEEDFYGDDSNNDMANEVADEDDEADDDDSDVASQVVMQRGGYMMRADEGMEVPNQHPITFPGVEAYLPANMADMLSGGYDVATGQVWQRPDFNAPQTTEDTGISYGSMDPGASAMEAEYSDEGVADEENFDQSEFMKGGAYKKGKSAYVSSVLKLVKKQMGGQEDNDPNDIAKKSDQADPIGQGLRSNILANYIGTLKNQGQMAIAKEQAEQAYDQMMQQQMQEQMMQPIQQYPVEEEGSLDEAQFGGFFQRRKQMNDFYGGGRRGLFNRQPRIPRGIGFAPPVESVDVRRTGWFGRPKEYTINFGQMPSVMPGYGVQGYGPGFYGYGYKSGVKKTPARKIVEDQAVYINSQTNKEVAAVTPGNEATNKDVKVEEKKTETTTTPASTTTTDGTTPNAATTTTTTETVKTTPTVQSSSQTAKETQVKKDIKKANNTAKVVKPESAKPEAPVAPRQKAPVYIPKVAAVADNTRVVSRVQPIVIPKVDLTKKAKPTNVFDMNTIMAQSKDPLAFTRATMIKDPKERSAAMQRIVYPWMKEDGGIVDNPFSDEYGALQRFVYGGDEDPSLAYIDQSDIDYSNSEDTTDPYFQRGGAFNTLFPANLSPSYGTRYMGARNAAGQAIPAMLGPNARIKSVDVHKSSWITGRPKKYSITFGHETSDPTKQNLITLNEPGKEGSKGTKGQSSTAKDPKALSKKELARGDRQAGRQRPWYAGKRYEQDFEEYELTPEEQKRVDENEARYQANVAKYHKDKANAANIINQMFNPQAQKPGMTQSQIQDFQQMISNPSGVPSYSETPPAVRTAEPGSVGSYAAPTGSSAGVTRTPEQFRADYLAGNIQQSERSQDGITYIKSSGEPITDEDFANYKKERELEQQYGADYVPRNPNLGPASDSYESYLDFVNSGQPLGEGMTRNVLTKEQYGQMYGHYSRGGALRKFIPQAQLGGDNPVVYTNNPALAGMTDVDMISLNPGIQGLGESPLTSFMNVNAPKRDESNDPKQYTVDPNQPQRHQTEKVYEGEGDVTMDFKTVKSVDPQAALLTGNAAARGVLGFVDRMQNKKREKEMYKNLTADNLYATDPSRDRGDYDTNTGLYRPNDMGQTWNSRSKQFGGENDYLNEDPDYVDGDEVYMTDEQIQDYLARGGQIEYL